MDNPGYEELIEKTNKFERFYNEDYPHSALEYKSPREVFEENLSLHKIAYFLSKFLGCITNVTKYFICSICKMSYNFNRVHNKIQRGHKIFTLKQLTKQKLKTSKQKKQKQTLKDLKKYMNIFQKTMKYYP